MDRDYVGIENAESDRAGAADLDHRWTEALGNGRRLQDDDADAGGASVGVSQSAGGGVSKCRRGRCSSDDEGAVVATYTNTGDGDLLARDKTVHANRSNRRRCSRFSGAGDQ